MAKKHFRKTHLFWLLPLILLLTPVVALLATPLFGVHWQGIGWHQGLTLERFWYQSNDCRLAEAHGARLSGLRPLTLTLDSLGINDCPGDDEPLSVPNLPALEVTVWALQYRDYPPLLVDLTQADGQWRGRAEFRGSELNGDYLKSSGRWRLTGFLDAAPLRQALTGQARVQGEGQWQPGEPFAGELVLLGQELGLTDQAPTGDVTVRADWNNDAWRLRAALDESLALGGGWVLEPGQDLTAEGRGMALRKADARLRAHGPQGSAALTVSSDHERLGRGQGRLTLSDGLGGDVVFRWHDHQATVEPFQVSLTDPALRVRLREAVTVPLAVEGEARLPLQVIYQSATLTTSDSAIYWRPNDLQWRGAVTLGGEWQGYRLSGGWRGDVGPAGAHGEPARVRLRDVDLDLTATVPVAGLAPPAWPVTATLQGRYRDIPFNADADARRDGQVWAGRVTGRGGPSPGLDGGVLTLDGRWDYADRPRLLSGATVHLERVVRGNMLIRPMTARLASPLVLAEDGPRGRLTLEAGGLVAERWTLPPVSGAARLDGEAVSAEFKVPRWDTSLNLQGRAGDNGYAGTLSGAAPLAPAMSRGLPMTLRSGDLSLDGDWRWTDRLTLEGRLRGRDVGVDWGSIQARDLEADLSLGWDGERPSLSTREPLSVANLDVGVPISDIRMELDSDLSTWTARRLHADVLGGEIRAPRLTWPSSDWQPVVLTRIELEQLAALQGEPVVTLSGEVGGYIPLQLRTDSVAVQEGRLANETPLALAILPSSGAQAMAQSNRAVSIALDALNPLRIDTFEAGVDMAADGWLSARVTIRGQNSQQNHLPVVFNYTHQENVLELLRSLRIGERIADEVMTESRQ